MKFCDSPGTMLRRSALWIAPLLLGITIFVVPVTNGWLKTFQLVLLAMTIGGWLWWLRQWRMAFLASLLLLMLAGVLFCLPSRGATSRSSLPQACANAMLRYEGVTYWWGGESARGIDCSGLIRRGMMDAAFCEGLCKLDGGLLRTAVDLWWHDCSAEALGEGYRGWTTLTLKTRSLNELDHASVRTGDIAVTEGGAHILACLGDKRWIQADPTAQCVIVETAPSRNGWFKVPVRLMRWRWLDQ